MGKSDAQIQWFLAHYAIGVKLRSLRIEKGLTLARLAEETGLSTALLSKLETERMLPTLPTLATISRVYGVGLGYFFREPTELSLSVTRKIAIERRARSSDAGICIPLNPGLASRRLDAYLLDLVPGDPVEDPQSKAFTALLVYVLEGRLSIDVGGMRDTLETGDCAYLESDLSLAWAPAGKQICRLLVVAPTQATPQIPTPFAKSTQ